jgi:hypothetical protein
MVRSDRHVILYEFGGVVIGAFPRYRNVSMKRRNTARTDFWPSGG